MDFDNRMLKDRLKALGARLSAAEVDIAAPLFRVVTLEAGEKLLEEGKPADAACIVWDGDLVVRVDSGHEEVEVRRLHPGALVGEISFLDGGPASATVEAQAAARVLALDRESFARLEETHPHVALEIYHALLCTLAARLRSATDHLFMLRDYGPGGPTARRGFLDAFGHLFGLRLS